MRRPKALHATALLIDQNGRFAADCGTELSDQASHIVRRRDIALKKDEAPGIGFGKEPPFRIGQHWTCTAGDKS
jgi:hypothetical protein